MAVHYLSNLDLDYIQEGLQQVFPEFAHPVSLQILGDGFSSIVILVSGKAVIRIAKNTEAMERHQRERILLPNLAPHLTIPVPQPEWFSGPSGYFPFGLIGYRLIRGVPFSMDLVTQVHAGHIAQDLARFLFELHQYPLEPARRLGIPDADNPVSLWEEIEFTFARYLSRGDFHKITAWWEKQRFYLSRSCFLPRLIHGDPWGENLLLNEKFSRLVGVVDFESVVIGDIAQDFSALKYMGQDQLRLTIEHYQLLGGTLGSHFSERYQAQAMWRELSGLRYAIRYPESGELEDALQKVQNELHSNPI